MNYKNYDSVKKRSFQKHFCQFYVKFHAPTKILQKCVNWAATVTADQRYCLVRQKLWTCSAVWRVNVTVISPIHNKVRAIRRKIRRNRETQTQHRERPNNSSRSSQISSFVTPSAKRMARCQKTQRHVAVFIVVPEKSWKSCRTFWSLSNAISRKSTISQQLLGWESAMRTIRRKLCNYVRIKYVEIRDNND